jgi:hypothetical protein
VHNTYATREKATAQIKKNHKENFRKPRKNKTKKLNKRPKYPETKIPFEKPKIWFEIQNCAHA